MINSKVEKALIEQIEKEGYSSSIYLSMASWAETKGLPGIAEWLYAQSDEERLHMLKLVKFVNERGGKALIPGFRQPGTDFVNVMSMFEEVLKHEQFISASINDVVAVCIAEKDYTTQHWLQWFVNEQIEEESNAMKILDKLELLGEGSLYLFDRDIMSLRQE
ncbi:MAG TPA: ferritin [Bacteroidales bacterium]|jgi:ferritin|nr:ferritin [Bacteroidales bacterium]